MSTSEFQEGLGRRAARAGIQVADAESTALEAYFSLLTSWNRVINLTALALAPPTDATFDRLFVEPLVAARQLKACCFGSPATERPRWLDLGTGGGSPAIPVKVACPGFQLTMVESRSRKAAFLREVVRALGLVDAGVENARFQDLSSIDASSDLVTIRGVRQDPELADFARRALRDDGVLALFQGTAGLSSIPGFLEGEVRRLTSDPESYLSLYRRVPRGT